MTKDEMKQALAEKVCTVVFQKLNGEERIMECTTNMAMIPEHVRPRAINVRWRDIDVIAAYDVRSAGWRSFRVDLVKEFNV